MRHARGGRQIVGLGNYDRPATRHSIGLAVVTELAALLGAAPLPYDRTCQAFVGGGRALPGIVLVRPKLYMNLSGQCVAPLGSSCAVRFGNSLRRQRASASRLASTTTAIVGVGVGEVDVHAANARRRCCCYCWRCCCCCCCCCFVGDGDGVIAGCDRWLPSLSAGVATAADRMRAAVKRFRVSEPRSQLLIVHDDADRAPGKIAFKDGGSCKSAHRERRCRSRTIAHSARSHRGRCAAVTTDYAPLPPPCDRRSAAAAAPRRADWRASPSSSLSSS